MTEPPRVYVGCVCQDLFEYKPVTVSACMSVCCVCVPRLCAKPPV